MAIDPSEHPAKPEQPQEGFAEGEDNPEAFPEDEFATRSDGAFAMAGIDRGGPPEPEPEPTPSGGGA